MNKSLVVALVLCLAGSVLAQEVNYNRAKQQARRDSALNDAEQQRIRGAASEPVAPPAAAEAAPAAPVDPTLQATLNNITSLQSDFAALSKFTGDKPEASQKISLLNNLSAAAQGMKASTTSVKKLAEDLMTAVSGKKKIASAQQTKLAREVHALFNSAHLTAAQQQSLLADVQKILMAGGASLDEAVNVVTDLKAVAAETK
jgi:hypothetical protein